MNKTIQKIKIDGQMLEIMGHMAARPERIFSIGQLLLDLNRNYRKSNYPTVFRKVRLLAEQGFLTRSRYGMANQLRINYENNDSVHLLSLIESKKRQMFMEDAKGSIRSILSGIIDNLGKNPRIRSVLIFGSYANKRDKKDSDMDLLIIYPPDRDIKNDVIGTIRAAQLRTNIRFNPVIVSTDEHNEMILDKVDNVGKESLLNHIILSGEYEYWKEIGKCYQERN